MKKLLLSVLMMFLTFWVFGVVNQINSSANGTRVNGYYIVEDFEGYDLDFAFPVSNTSLSALVKQSPTNAAEKSIYLSGSNNSVYFIKNTTLPTGKVLADFDSIFLDLYLVATSYKNLEIWIDGTKVHSVSNLINGNNVNLGTRKIAFASFNQSGAATVLSNAGNQVAIGIGCSRMNGTTFYVDNIKLSGGGEDFPPETTYTVTLNPGTGTCAFPSLTETEEGAGVTLPTASPSAKCGIAGYSFVGWAGSEVEETYVAPEMLSDGTWAIPQDTTLYAVYFDGSFYNSTPSCNESLKGTVVDGWLYIEDVEYNEVNYIFPVYKAENASSLTTATAVIDPTDANNQAILFANKNWGHYLQLNVTLPAGRTLNDYEAISFDAYCPGGLGTYQSLNVGINQNLFGVANNGSNTLTSWSTLERAFPAGFSTYSSLNTFTLELGFRTSAKDYYIDNVKLKQDPGITTNINDRKYRVVSFADNTIFLKENGNILIVDLNGRTLKSVQNVHMLDVSELSKGIYIVKAIVAGNSVVEKIVKN